MKLFAVVSLLISSSAANASEEDCCLAYACPGGKVDMATLTSGSSGSVSISSSSSSGTSGHSGVSSAFEDGFIAAFAEPPAPVPAEIPTTEDSSVTTIAEARIATMTTCCAPIPIDDSLEECTDNFAADSPEATKCCFTHATACPGGKVVVAASSSAQSMEDTWEEIPDVDVAPEPQITLTPAEESSATAVLGPESRSMTMTCCPLPAILSAGADSLQKCPDDPSEVLFTSHSDSDPVALESEHGDEVTVTSHQTEEGSDLSEGPVSESGSGGTAVAVFSTEQGQSDVCCKTVRDVCPPPRPIKSEDVPEFNIEGEPAHVCCQAENSYSSTISIDIMKGCDEVLTSVNPAATNQVSETATASGGSSLQTNGCCANDGTTCPEKYLETNVDSTDVQICCVSGATPNLEADLSACMHKTATPALVDEEDTADTVVPDDTEETLLEDSATKKTALVAALVGLALHIAM